jgi:hypothetical protein
VTPQEWYLASNCFEETPTIAKTPMLIAFVVVVVLFLIFGGGAMTGSNDGRG